LLSSRSARRRYLLYFGSERTRHLLYGRLEGLEDCVPLEDGAGLGAC